MATARSLRTRDFGVRLAVRVRFVFCVLAEYAKVVTCSLQFPFVRLIHRSNMDVAISSLSTPNAKTSLSDRLEKVCECMKLPDRYDASTCRSRAWSGLARCQESCGFTALKAFISRGIISATMGNFLFDPSFDKIVFSHDVTSILPTAGYHLSTDKVEHNKSCQ